MAFMTNLPHALICPQGQYRSYSALLRRTVSLLQDRMMIHITIEARSWDRVSLPPAIARRMQSVLYLADDVAPVPADVSKPIVTDGFPASAPSGQQD